MVPAGSHTVHPTAFYLQRQVRSGTLLRQIVTALCFTRFAVLGPAVRVLEDHAARSTQQWPRMRNGVLLSRTAMVKGVDTLSQDKLLNARFK